MGDFARSTQTLMMIIVILGAINFGLYERIYNKDFKAVRQDSQIIWYIPGLFVLFALLFIAHFLSRETNQDSAYALSDVIFHGVSASASAGFSTSPVSGFPASIVLVLIIAMIIGGCKGSTAGGIKISRLKDSISVVIHFFIASRKRPEILFTFHGEAVKARFSKSTYQAISLCLLWLMTGLAGLVLLSLSVNAPLSDIIFETFSALGCVGLSSGLTSPELSGPAKYILMILMWLGRLEIIPIFVFLLTPFHR